MLQLIRILVSRRNYFQRGIRGAIQGVGQRNRKNRSEQVDVELQFAIRVKTVNGHGAAADVSGGHEIESQAPGAG